MYDGILNQFRASMVSVDDIMNDEERNIKDMEAKRLLQESIDIQANKVSFPLKKMRRDLRLAKNVLCECMCDLYIKSLIIDDPELYSNTLRSACRSECMSIMESATNISELRDMFSENVSPYITNALIIAEAAADNHTDEEAKEFADEVLLNKEDLDMIQDFENCEGVDEYAKDIQDRVVTVCQAENELAQKHEEEVKNIVDMIQSSNPEETMTESVQKAINLFPKAPPTMFNAIYLKKSKILINESAAGSSLEDRSEEILTETICLYTLLETIHATGFKTYGYDDKRSFKTQCTV